MQHDSKDLDDNSRKLITVVSVLSLLVFLLFSLAPHI